MADDEPKESENPFLNTKEAAAWLRLTKNTLEKMRVNGTGPLYRKHGRYVRYHIDDLVDYSKAGQRRSTSDQRGVLPPAHAHRHPAHRPPSPPPPPPPPPHPP